MTDAITELEQLIADKGISPETAARFIGSTTREVYRWLKRENQPNAVYRMLIMAGIRRMRKNL